MNLLIINS